MSSVVMKFGGTSVADADAMARLAAIVRRQIEKQQARGEAASKPPVVVVSALSKVTDGLLEVARLIEHGDRDGATTRLNDLVDRHVAVAAGVASGARLAAVIRDVRAEFVALSDMVRAIAALHEVSPRLLDAVAATGELASSRMVAAALTEAGAGRLGRCGRCSSPMLNTRAPCPTWRDLRPRAADDRAGVRTRRGGGPRRIIGATDEGITTTLAAAARPLAAIAGACLDDDSNLTDVDACSRPIPASCRRRTWCRSSFAEASSWPTSARRCSIRARFCRGGEEHPGADPELASPDNPGTLITADPQPTDGHLTAIARATSRSSTSRRRAC